MVSSIHMCFMLEKAFLNVCKHGVLLKMGSRYWCYNLVYHLNSLLHCTFVAVQNKKNISENGLVVPR